MECESALQRCIRERSLDAAASHFARERLKVLAGTWHEAPPTVSIRKLALRLFRTHPLRDAEAEGLSCLQIQLIISNLFLSDFRPSTL